MKTIGYANKPGLRAKNVPWQQLLLDISQNLISFRSLSAEDVLKNWCKSLYGFRSVEHPQGLKPKILFAFSV